jgi:hypothetical protein
LTIEIGAEFPIGINLDQLAKSHGAAVDVTDAEKATLVGIGLFPNCHPRLLPNE